MCPNVGPNPQPRHVPLLGIEPATFQFAGGHPRNWVTPVRAYVIILMMNVKHCGHFGCFQFGATNKLLWWLLKDLGLYKFYFLLHSYISLKWAHHLQGTSPFQRRQWMFSFLQKHKMTFLLQCRYLKQNKGTFEMS